MQKEKNENCNRKMKKENSKTEKEKQMKTLFAAVIAITVLGIAQVSSAVTWYDDAKVVLGLNEGTDATTVGTGEVTDLNAPNSNNTTVYGTPTWDAVPGIGNGMSINFNRATDDAVGFGDGANNEIQAMTSTLTMWTRARINQLGGHFGHHMLLARRDGTGGNHFMFEVKEATDTIDGVATTWLYLAAEVYGAGGASTINAVNDFHPDPLFGSYSLAVGQWFEYAVTYDANDPFGLRLYFRTDPNGAFGFVTFAANTAGILNTTSANTLMNRRSDGLSYYRGYSNIESMVLWDRALSLDDLNTISGAIPEPASLTLIGLALAVFARKGRK